MTEAEWLACAEPNDILYDRDRRRRYDERKTCHPQVAGERKLRLYACACFRLAFPRLRYPADRRALEVAERYADGAASEADLDEAAKPCGRTAACLTYRPAVTAARHVAGDEEFQPDHPAGPQEPLPKPTKCRLLRCVFGNPFRPVTADPRWLTSPVLDLARAVYESSDFGPMPILADALQDAGCEDADVLDHCRGPGPHARGCWVVDLILGKT